MEQLRQPVLTLSLLLITTGLACSQSQREIWNNPKPVAGVEHGSFHSESMDEDVGYNVLLPQDYREGEARYAVVYWLHGLGGNEARGARIASSISKATVAAEVGGMIFVFVNGGRTSMYADSADGEVMAETALIEELIPHIDATYRTIAAREGRAIEGFSMGGYGALMLAAKHPQLFSSAVSYAGALHDNETLSGSRKQIYDAMFGSEEAFDEYSPYRWMEAHAEQLRDSLALRLVVGSEDPTLGFNSKFRELLLELEIDHQYVIVEGMGHDIAGYYREVGLDGIRFLAEHFRK